MNAEHNEGTPNEQTTQDNRMTGEYNEVCIEYDKVSTECNDLSTEYKDVSTEYHDQNYHNTVMAFPWLPKVGRFQYDTVLSVV